MQMQILIGNLTWATFFLLKSVVMLVILTCNVRMAALLPRLMAFLEPSVGHNFRRSSFRYGGVDRHQISGSRIGSKSIEMRL